MDVPRFVIQQHDATTLHFDFRLEVEGVLRSWAVPKGPSTDPAEKRLAIEVEDHSLAYGGYEGVISAGYGRGAVIVWDRGDYRPLTEDFANALENGHASFWLEGEKLRGGWALTRTNGRGEKAKWLLVKRRDELADAGDPVRERPESVKSGRTIAQLRGERD
jgi:DNA ligase D-like protein (predicted 3'-phosphoesterase)